jgi:hypothetical protein
MTTAEQGAEEDIWTKRDEVTGGWRKLHNEELHDLYSSPSIIRIINWGRRGTLIGYWWESQKERGQ